MTEMKLGTVESKFADIIWNNEPLKPGELVKLAEAAIRKHEPFDNEQIDGNTVVLHLMKKYCINVPLRTQGWINNALAKIVFHEDKISYMYYSSSKNSTVFRQYLQELAEVIECNNAEGVSSAMN